MKGNNIEVTGAFAVHYENSNMIVYQLNFTEKQMSQISRLLQVPSRRGEKAYADALSNISKKYYIEHDGKDKNRYYQLDIMNDLLNALTANKVLSVKKISDLIDVQHNKLKVELFIYTNLNCIEKSEDITEKSELYIYEIKKSNYIKNKLFTVGDTTGNKGIKLISADKSLVLPCKDCIADFVTKKPWTGNKRQNGKSKQTGYFSRVEVFNPYKFDKLFDTSETMKKYVKSVIEKMQKKDADRLTLTSNKLKVNVKGDKDDLIKILNNKKSSLRSFANFNGSKRRKIQNISSEDLNKVLTRLRFYAKRSDSVFDQNNVPQIDFKSNSINLSSRNMIIFAALLDNSIMEKLLDRKIVSPNFDDFI